MPSRQFIQVGPDHKLIWQGHSYPCALGKGGLTLDKSEGDGATPVGTFGLNYVLFRPDRVKCPITSLKTYALNQSAGWCDAPDHQAYNQAVDLPFESSHEKLWREDHIYDIIVVLNHNQNPTIPHKGSAIFFHLARENFKSTEGCVAVELNVMLRILKTIKPQTCLKITA